MTIASPTENPVENKLGPAKALPHTGKAAGRTRDRKSTRLNSSHLVISYAVFFFKKNVGDGPVADHSVDDTRPLQSQRWGVRVAVQSRPDVLCRGGGVMDVARLLIFFFYL